jgi:uncharacterized protein (DUF885 family)
MTARLAKDSRFLYPDSEQARQAALADFRKMQDEQLVRARAVRAGAEGGDRRQACARVQGENLAWRVLRRPAIDGTRPGIFYANLRDMSEVPKFGMRTLAVHEGVPGHHFQIALAQQQKGVPTFRTVLPFVAYGEGWALYAEWLAVEMGLYRDDAFGDLGRLRDEMLRAVRLVVDTGLHAQRWPRARAIAYMVDKTGMAEAAVVSEVERYIVMPGQACAYQVGMLRIRAARERAQKSARPALRRRGVERFPRCGARQWRVAAGRARRTGRCLDQGPLLTA